MNIITDRDKIYFLQRQLNNKLKILLDREQLRLVSIVHVNQEVEIHYNDRIRKWFYYQDNFTDRKYTFFFGKWTTGGGKLPSSGSISVSSTGEIKNAGVFAERDGEIYLLHSGRMGKKTIKEFYNSFEGETIDILVNGQEKKYAIVCLMGTDELAQNVIEFF